MQVLNLHSGGPPDQLSQTHCVTLSKTLSLSGPQFPQQRWMRGYQVCFRGLPEQDVSRQCWPEGGGGELTDILVKTDSSRDRTDRYMRIRWPPKRFWMYSGMVTI